MSKKQQVIEEIYKICQKRGNDIFDNKLVKEVSVKVGVGNPFDVTKIDNKNKLPTLLKEKDVAIIHLGKGYHRFIKGIDKVYHTLEPISNLVDWQYKKSLLNQYNTSESNILSVANNQRILHDFLFNFDAEFISEDIAKRAKTYFPHRTKTSLEFSCGEEKISLTDIQIEIDLTIEFDGNIGVFECKNGKPDNFVIYQLYYPFLYYHKANLIPKVKEIFAVYMVRESGDYDILKLWSYRFASPLDITSIELVKSKSYRLIPE